MIARDSNKNRTLADSDQQGRGSPPFSDEAHVSAGFVGGVLQTSVLYGLFTQIGSTTMASLDSLVSGATVLMPSPHVLIGTMNADSQYSRRFCLPFGAIGL